jgi:hypothetical protein
MTTPTRHPAPDNANRPESWPRVVGYIDGRNAGVTQRMNWAIALGTYCEERHLRLVQVFWDTVGSDIARARPTVVALLNKARMDAVDAVLIPTIDHLPGDLYPEIWCVF